MRNVIVTGGSRGIGLAITRRLVTAGYRVIVVARRDGSELKAASAKSAAGALAFRAFDLADIAAIGPFVRGLRKEFGPFHALVNNAGIGTSGVLGTMRDEQIERLIRVNTLSPVVFTKYVVRSMMVERHGCVVNMSSVVGATGYTSLSVYSATKASLVGFTRSLAREVGQLGITVNALAPGFVATEMTQELSSGQREQIARRSALRRLVEVDDIGAAVEFLIGDGARNITGTVITVDAGNSA
jgi:3-oxoacyl-[acyl-carrier protein] reductase